MKIETVLAQLGRGGFGIVDKVQDADGNLFARKTFSPPSYVPESETDQLRKRFKREVTTQQHLHAPEIMPVLYAQLDIKKPWFLMPLADKTYEQQIQEDRTSGKVNIEALAEILNALEYLHDKGYVHRDLNPKNILHHDGHWKLSDFGAVLPPPGHTVTLTGGTVIYTEQYCAPEQKHDFHKTRASADIYSLGCILHDIFGKGPRVPYSKQIGTGRIGLLIEKCTEPKPERRPSVRVLRGMLLPALADLGGICKVADEKSEHWLQRLETIADWKDDDFDDFARFFAALDVGERADGHQNEYVSSLSTPFLTRIQADALVKILGRNDGASCAVIEKYCDWAGNTAFEFGFSDSVASCLAAIFDNADAAIKAVALIALIKLGRSHNRFYVMRTMLGRCGAKSISNDLAQRFSIEIKTEELELDFLRCVEIVEWDTKLLHSELAEFCP